MDEYCLHGDAWILLEGGKSKLVRDVKVGDRVISTSPCDADECDPPVAATIQAVVRMPVRSATLPMVAVGSLLITPLHPIRVAAASQSAKEWVRPKDIAPTVELEVPEVFNFVVENRGSLFVNNIEVCTLGQFCSGIDSADSYFGSERVVTYLQTHDSWPIVTVCC